MLCVVAVVELGVHKANTRKAVGSQQFYGIRFLTIVLVLLSVRGVDPGAANGLLPEWTVNWLSFNTTAVLVGMASMILYTVLWTHYRASRLTMPLHLKALLSGAPVICFLWGNAVVLARLWTMNALVVYGSLLFYDSVMAFCVFTVTVQAVRHLLDTISKVTPHSVATHKLRRIRNITLSLAVVGTYFLYLSSLSLCAFYPIYLQQTLKC